jgi:two-component system, LytTR family, response regulator
MRVVIADDEAPARAKLRRLLTREADIEVVGECGSGREAAATIRRASPDVVFLDIEMPGLDGFGVLAAIEHAEAPHVVFVTAYDDHALRAFDVGAVDYLLKPYTPARFALVLDRARARVATPAAPADAAPPPPLRRLLVQQAGRARFLDVRAIDRIDADRNYLEVVAGRDRFRLRTTIAALAERLDSAQFLRLNRSTIVRIDLIAEMYEWSHGDYRAVLKDGSAVIWSRRYRAAASKQFVVGG